ARPSISKSEGASTDPSEASPRNRSRGRSPRSNSRRGPGGVSYAISTTAAQPAVGGGSEGGRSPPPSSSVRAVEEGELEEQEVPVDGEERARAGQGQAKEEDGARASEDRHRGHDD